MVATTFSKDSQIPESQSSKSVTRKFTSYNVRKCQNAGLTVAKASKKFGVPKPTFIKKLREDLNIFGWKQKSGKELRLDHEKIQLEVKLMKVDSNNAEIDNTCVVLFIDDSNLFEEAKEKISRRLGEGVYTFKFKRSNDEWVSINSGMDYDVCISYFKDIKRAEEASEAGQRFAAQRIAANVKPYKSVRMEIYAQLMPPS